MDTYNNYEKFEHRRLNPLTKQWVLVCPHRDSRPWQGKVEKMELEDLPEWDPQNPLCPRVTRPGGTKNPDYKGVFVFDNDFPALKVLDTDIKKICSEEELFTYEPVQGICRVMCYNPDSRISISKMNRDEGVIVIREWMKQFESLIGNSKIKWVQIFENRGKEMGCSNSHPHCQIWSCSFLPNEIVVEDQNQLEYFSRHNSPLLLDYAAQEIQKDRRVILKNNHWLVVVPYWAVWPFETLLLPLHRRIPRIFDLTDNEVNSLSDILINLYRIYDKLFDCPFPLSMGWHCAPASSDVKYDSESLNHWQLHAHFYPPLLRSATIKKFMVGFELLSSPQRDLTPEAAAELLLLTKNRN